MIVEFTVTLKDGKRYKIGHPIKKKDKVVGRVIEVKLVKATDVLVIAKIWDDKTINELKKPLKQLIGISICSK